MPGPWKSASEQAVLPVEADSRRLGEWPVGPAPGATHLYALDPLGVSLTRLGSHYHLASLPALSDALPPRRFNVLLCGAAAAISDLMLLYGARIVEECLPKHEPIVRLCVAPFPSGPAEIASRVEVAVMFLEDPDTIIDAVVWYDIEHPGYMDELRRLDVARKARGAGGWFGRRRRARPRVPMLVLRPYATWGHAAKEFAAVRGGHLMAPSHDEYLALQRMIETGEDDDSNAIL